MQPAPVHLSASYRYGARFRLGRLAATPAALAALANLGRVPLEFVDRHARGDWSDADAEGNRFAEVYGLRIFSSYAVTPDLTVWVITEADRSVTTVLLPSDY